MFDCGLGCSTERLFQSASRVLFRHVGIQVATKRRPGCSLPPCTRDCRADHQALGQVACTRPRFTTLSAIASYPPRGAETAPRSAEAPACGAISGRAQVSAEQRARMLELLAAGKSVSEIAAGAGVTRGVARHRKRTGGQASRPGQSPFFTQDEELLLFQFLRVRAMIGRGLTRDAFLSSCEEYILTLLPARQQTANLYFGGTTKPGQTFFELFKRRWPGLKRFRVGMLEQARAENSKPEVLAKWYAGLELCYRELQIKHMRQIFHMDQTHVRSRDLLVGDRAPIVAPDDLDKPEVVSSSIGAATSGCSAAFTVSPGGVAAPHFWVVDGATSGHAYAVVTENGTKRYEPLAAGLSKGSVVTRRRPPGFDKGIFDAYASHFSAFAAGYFRNENKLLAVDGVKVHLSALGLI